MRLFFTGFWEGFKEFGLKVNSAVNFVLLFLVYFIALGPVATLLKAKKKAFLKLNHEEVSYWIKKEKSGSEDYYRTF